MCRIAMGNKNRNHYNSSKARKAHRRKLKRAMEAIKKTRQTRNGAIKNKGFTQEILKTFGAETDSSPFGDEKTDEHVRPVHMSRMFIEDTTSPRYLRLMERRKKREMAERAAARAQACRGVSAAAARAGLFAGHLVKQELVLGPEVLQPPDYAFQEVKRTAYKEETISPQVPEFIAIKREPLIFDDDPYLAECPSTRDIFGQMCEINSCAVKMERDHGESGLPLTSIDKL